MAKEIKSKKKGSNAATAAELYQFMGKVQRVCIAIYPPPLPLPPPTWRPPLAGKRGLVALGLEAIGLPRFRCRVVIVS